MRAGVGGLLHDQTRPSRIPPLAAEIVQQVVALTLGDPPGETTHWNDVDAWKPVHERYVEEFPPEASTIGVPQPKNSV